MIKKAVVLIVLLALSVSIHAQSKLDSLRQLLHSAGPKEQVKLYSKMSREVYYKNILQLREFALVTDSLAQITGQDSLRVEALNMLGYAALNSGKVDDAFRRNEQALKLASDKKLAFSKRESEFFKGYLLYATGSSDSALVVLNKAYEKSLNANDTSTVLKCLNAIASAYLGQARYEKALENYTNAYTLAEQLKREDLMTNISLNMGTALMYNENLEQAIEHYKKVISRIDTNDVSIIYATAMNNMGTCYSRMAQHEKALVYLNKALPVYKKLNNKYFIAQTYSNLGQSNFFLGKEGLAEKFLNKANEINREINASNHLIVNLILLGRLHTGVGDYKKARKILDEAIELTEKYNIQYNSTDLYKVLSLYYNKVGNFEKALEYKQRELNVRDSTMNEKRQQIIAKLETQHQTQLTEKENEMLRKDVAMKQMEIQKHRQLRNLLIAISVLIFALAAITWSRVRVMRRVNRIIKKQKRYLEEANRTKDKFFSIIAHDLRSPFNSLVGLSELLTDNFEALDDQAKKLYISQMFSTSKLTLGLLENLLNWSRIQRGAIQLKNESLNLSSLVDYAFSLHKSSADQKRIHLENVTASETEIFCDRFSMETVFNNLISNAIKFTHPGGSVKIAARPGNNIIIVSIVDTGVGISIENQQHIFKVDSDFTTLGTQKEKGTGLGLVLCKEFIEMNNGTIEVESEEGRGTEFQLTLPAAKSDSL